MTQDPLLELLACPRCDKTPLRPARSGYRCGGCRTDYPLMGGIPWLFAEPESAQEEWRNRLHFELQRLARETARLESALAANGTRPATRQRLELLAAALKAHRGALRELLAPLDLQSRQGAYETHLALRTRLPRDQGLTTYYANVHRDWAWGEAENDASLEEVRWALEAADGDDPGSVLVLGAGAGRLAYDVHMQLGPARTVALDFNPLLVLIAAALVRGESLTLHEFPIAPRSLADTAPRRTLTAPAPARPGFHLLLADALRPPAAQRAFDTVLTPWLVDIVPETFDALAARINGLLAPGGRWVSFGSLSFEHPEPELRYSREEALAAVVEAGFAEPAVREATIPYMCSPASRHGRAERVLTFAARKAEEARPPPRYKALPDWLVTGKAPVPLAASFQAQALTTRIYAHVMSLIDGRRSIEDMAALLEQQRLMTRAEAIPAVRNFLTRMYDDSRKGG